MTILSGDIKLLASKIMDDVPEGGGGPSGAIVPYGRSNRVFSDMTEVDRTGGDVSIRQLHAWVDTPNTDTYQDVNIIVGLPQDDPAISITLAKCALFDQRSDIANAIANYLIQGPFWGGYLLENHVEGQRAIQILHRPGTPAPSINRTLVLIYQEGLPGERIQYVRVTRTETAESTFSVLTASGVETFKASVTKADISDALRFAFPGSPPSPLFTGIDTATKIRDTTMADAAVYYGAARLATGNALGDVAVAVDSVYSQLVPSSRAETTALDQRPAATTTIVLAESPIRIETPVAAHTQRIKIGQENRGFSFVAMLKPLPEPGTIVVHYMVLGIWYTMVDDGAGAFTGMGAGQAIYGTGSASITLPALPDDGSAIIWQWAERVGYDNRSSQDASVRPPEYSWLLADEGVVPGSITLTWYSAGVLRTATDDGAGKFTGDGAGVVDYPSNTVLLRPAYLPDPGADINVAYTVDLVHTETFLASGSAPDPAGFIALTLAQQPAAGTLAVSWATARQVSNTSGGQDGTTSAIKNTDVIYTTKVVPEYYDPGVIGAGSTVVWAKGP